MKPSPRFVALGLAILIWVVVGWPFARRYHPIAEGLFHFVFLLGVITLPTFLEWLDRRSNRIEILYLLSDDWALPERVAPFHFERSKPINRKAGCSDPAFSVCRRPFVFKPFYYPEPPD